MSQFNFSNKASGTRQSRCKACFSAYNTVRYAVKGEEMRAANRANRLKDVDAYRARKRERYAENPHKRELAAQASERWNQQHPGEARSRASAWRDANPEWKAANDAAWRKANRGRKVANEVLRTKHIALVGPHYTGPEWESLKDRYDHRCLGCGRQEPAIALTFDHVIPITRGGTNDIGNGQPLCDSCNKRKGARIIDFR